MPYRYRDPSPVLDNLLGTGSAPGALAYFYVLGDVNTPKDTYQEYSLTTPNPNPIQLDENGRFPNPVWLNGDYTYELKAANGSSIVNPTDIRPEIAPGQALPDPLGHAGEFVTTDGVTFQMSGPIWLNPDPTGSPGYMLVVNSTGDGYILQPQPTPPEIPDPEIVITVSPPSFRAGVSDDTTKYLAQYGSGTVPANPGGRTSSVTVTLPTALVACFGITVTPNTNVVGSFGIGATYAVTGYTLGAACSSFSVEINSADDGGDSGYQLINAWNFTWKAEGTVTVT